MTLYIKTEQALHNILSKYPDVLIFWSKNNCQPCIRKKPIFLDEGFYYGCKKVIIDVNAWNGIYQYKFVPMIEHYKKGVFTALINIE